MSAAVDPFIVGQVPAELNRMRDLYIERAPKRVLEIGVFYGGTLREWLANAAPNATIVAVDPEHQNPNAYAGWRKPSTKLFILKGRSQDLSVEIAGYAPYDWVFIDGDHTQDAVDADLALALRLTGPGGTILIHDIAAEGFPPTPPRIAFDRITAAGYLITSEIVETPPTEYGAENGHGIGVVQL